MALEVKPPALRRRAGLGAELMLCDRRRAPSLHAGVHTQRVCSNILDDREREAGALWR